MRKLPVKYYGEILNILRCWLSISLNKIYSRPSFIVFFITSRCNSKCKTCDIWRKKPQEELSLKEIRSLAKQLKELRVPYIAISGGEPFIREDIFEIISFFKEQNILVQISTNGILLNKAKINELIKTGVSRISISIDSHNRESYYSIRGVDKFELVRDNLRYLIEKTRNENISVETNTVISNLNLDEIPDLIEWLEKIGVDNIGLSPMHVEDKNIQIENKDELLPNDMGKIEKIINYLIRKKKQTGKIGNTYLFLKGMGRYFLFPRKLVYPCYSGYLTADVHSNGDVNLCIFTPTLGNVRETPLKYLLRAKEAQRTREKMTKGICPGCYVSCKTECSLIARPRHFWNFAIDKGKRTIDI